MNGLERDSADEPVCGQQRRHRRERTRLQTRMWGRTERVGCVERVPWKHTSPCVRYTANGNLPYDAVNSNWGSVTTQRQDGRKGHEGGDMSTPTTDSR